MIEIEPEVPRRVRILFMMGGGVLLFVLVMTIILMGRTPEPSHKLDDDPYPPIQQRYNVDPLRPRPADEPDEQDAATFTPATPRQATPATSQPSAAPDGH